MRIQVSGLRTLPTWSWQAASEAHQSDFSCEDTGRAREILDGSGEEQIVSTIELATTPVFGHGGRIWLSCPAQRDGQPCGKRAMKLYLPRDEHDFACRSCYGERHLRTNRGALTGNLPPQVIRFMPIPRERHGE